MKMRSNCQKKLHLSKSMTVGESASCEGRERLSREPSLFLQTRGVTACQMALKGLDQSPYRMSTSCSFGTPVYDNLSLARSFTDPVDAFVLSQSRHCSRALRSCTSFCDNVRRLGSLHSCMVCHLLMALLLFSLSTAIMARHGVA